MIVRMNKNGTIKSILGPYKKQANIERALREEYGL